jgi:hypothetical protein
MRVSCLNRHLESIHTRLTNSRLQSWRNHSQMLEYLQILLAVTYSR